MKALFIPAVIVAAALSSGALASPAQNVYSIPGEWLDDQGHSQSLEGWRGSYTVMTMAYGACRQVCSTSLRVVHDIEAAAASRHTPLRLIVVGLDPRQDKPADWAALRDERKPWFKDVSFLSGSETLTRNLARAIGVKYWHYGDHVMHDFRIVLIAPDGSIAKVMDKFDQDPNSVVP